MSADHPANVSSGMPMTSAFEFPDQVVTGNLGVVYGLVVRSMGVGGVAAGFKALRRGEVSQYTQLLEDSRRHAIDRLAENARLVGADGVIAGGALRLLRDGSATRSGAGTAPLGEGPRRFGPRCRGLDADRGALPRPADAEGHAGVGGRCRRTPLRPRGVSAHRGERPGVARTVPPRGRCF